MRKLKTSGLLWQGEAGKIVRKRLEPHARIPPHDHRGAEVFVLLAEGALVLEQGEARLELRAGEAAHLAGEVPVALTAGPEGAAFWVVLAGREVRQLRAEHRALLELARKLPDPEVLVAFKDALAAHSRYEEATVFRNLDAATRELMEQEHALIDRLLERIEQRPDHPEARAWVEQLVTVLEGHFRDEERAAYL